MNKKLNFNELMPDDQISLKIMQDRAALLSVEDSNENDIRLLMVDYIKFVLNGDESYGIPYQDVQEVKNLINLTSVPKAPDFVSGIMYWRGKLITIIDLAKYFALKSSIKPNNRKYVAIIVKDKLILGLAFDDVAEVNNYLPESLDKYLPINNKIKDQHIHGIHQGRTTILNVHTILNDISDTLMNKKERSHE